MGTSANTDWNSEFDVDKATHIIDEEMKLAPKEKGMKQFVPQYDSNLILEHAPDRRGRQMIAMGVTDPVGKPVSENRQMCYNAMTDVLWSWTDASDRYEPEEMRWMVNITNASENNPELRKFRTLILKTAGDCIFVRRLHEIHTS